ncbi:MAG TPA: hypothetical protein VGD77_18485 [Gemmatimonadaceae bacterium]
MRRLTLALLGTGALALPARAQQVPGRDLLEFPVAAMGEPAALAREAGGGLWNPAQARLDSGRVRLSAVALNTPIEQGVASFYLAANAQAGRAGVLTLSVLRALVTDLLRTETDPQSLGDEIPYRTTVLSAGLSRAVRGMHVGATLRHRSGLVDVDRGSATSLDAGVAIDSVGRFPLRVGASTFLFSPWSRTRERARFSAAADYAVFARGSREARVGASLAHSEQAGSERYLYASGRWGWLTARGGMATEHYAGRSTERMRMGFGLQYSRYQVGVAREESGAGLGPSYQFMLTSVFK